MLLVHELMAMPYSPSLSFEAYHFMIPHPEIEARSRITLAALQEWGLFNLSLIASML
ncbi:hypothetical protein KT99_20771 [Shewanella benthica KT99]|uniref:Uncharacterized protein n=1 Tax=Shewanella benthica KT99 TaxID=314608 RepID=A9D755_9GAMM|nr:hypothetical protein KT99_20771 [Shewanella benthica KT99]